MKLLPPKRALQFLRWFCREDYLDEIEGDLTEIFIKQSETSPRKAKWKFITSVIKCFRPEFMKSFIGHQPNAYSMYKSYVKIGWRNLLKNKVYSFINISGLTLGLTFSMLIAMWVQSEYDVDAFHNDIDRIYTVTSTGYAGQEITYAGYDTPGLLGEELPKVFPEVELSCSYNSIGWNMLGTEDQKVKQPGSCAGPDFFSIFSYRLLSGSPETALQSPKSIAISRKVATILFGSPEDALNRSVLFENNADLKVTAVFEDPGDNVSEKFEYIINWDFYVQQNPGVKDWNNTGPLTFVKLHEQSDASVLKSKMQHFLKNYNEDYSDLDRNELGLQSFQTMYLHSHFKDGKAAGGRIEYVRLFSVVGIFILLIACANFMNLSTARSLKRAKEVGVRKVSGAIRTSLVGQFMVESLLMSSIAIVLALVLLYGLMPHFNVLTEKHIQLPFMDKRFWAGVIVLTLLTTILSGSYPALLLSSFKPISILKRNFDSKTSSLIFRRGLVIFQFTLSIIFIIGMIVVTLQVSFLQNKNLGYEKHNLVYLPMTGSMAGSFSIFKQEALKIRGILEVSEMRQRPVELENTTGGVEWEGKAPDNVSYFTQVAVGYDFVKAMQATLLNGRDFSPDFADSNNYLINEKAWKLIGYKNPVGMPLTFWGDKGTIIGVVKDFHFNSLHVPIEPLVIRLNKRHNGYALIRIKKEEIRFALIQLEELHKKLNPDFIFAHQFAEEEYFFSYKNEMIIERLSKYFAFLAIFISSLGLFGLVIFTAEQRIKEIGIRKVLGASVSQIVLLLSGDFIRLVLISIILASPIAYYLMKQWLTNFAYPIEMQWWMFVLSAVGALIIALLTMSIQAVKASLANPVDSLRNE